MLKLDYVGYSNKPYLSGVDKLIVGEKILQKEVHEGTLWIKSTNIEGIFEYGLTDETGYTWTSRTGVLNKEFDVALIECCYRHDDRSYRCCAIDFAHLDEILRDSEYKLDPIPELCFEDKEPYYKLRKISNDD